MASVNGVTYIGGNFTLASDHAGSTQQRTYLAAENAATGALTAWAPVLNGRVYVLALSPDHTVLYAGGAFTTVNGEPHPHLVAFDVATGNIDRQVGPLAIGGAVKAIAPVGNNLYIGGAFTSVAGVSHHNLAELTLNDAGVFAPNAAWKPSADGGDVRDLIVDDATKRVVVAGWFTSADGQKAQGYLAAVSATTGALLPWANHATAPVLDIARSGSTLYAGMAGPGGTALAYDFATGKQLWYYMTDGNIQAVTVVNGWPVFGMHGDYVAPKANQKLSEYGTSARIRRYKVFMLSPQGVLQPWTPVLNSGQGVLGVFALSTYASVLNVGGDFTGVGGHAQARFAIFTALPAGS